MQFDNKKNTKVIITNVQSEYDGETTTTKTVVDAISGYSDGIKVLIYELEDSLNVLMLANGYVKLVKSGDSEAEMIFSQGKKSQAVFTAEGQSLMLDIYTGSCLVDNNGSVLELEYSMYMGTQLLSEYRLNIKEV